MNDIFERSETISAVFVASDVVAFGVIQAIKNKGLIIPNDIAVVGYDDVSLTRYVEPFLTTVQLPAYEIGWETGVMCLAQIEDSNGNCEGKHLPTKLIIRDSCGAKS